LAKKTGSSPSATFADQLMDERTAIFSILPRVGVGNNGLLIFFDYPQVVPTFNFTFMKIG
jgi:hypothetical protein